MRTAKLALAFMIPASMAVLIVGATSGVIETTYQPMKVAAMEAQWDTCSPCSFSAAQIGGWTSSEEDPKKIIVVPHLLSILATGTWDGQVVGLNQLQKQYEKKYGPGDYIPNLFIQYWSMRVMAYIGFCAPTARLVGRLAVATQGLETSRVFLWVATWGFVAPFIMNTAGWLLTESGRQPWVVQGLLLTEDGNSPSVSFTEVAITLAVVLVLYIILGIVWGFLMVRYSRRGLEPSRVPGEPTLPDAPTPPRALTY